MSDNRATCGTDGSVPMSLFTAVLVDGISYRVKNSADCRIQATAMCSVVWRFIDV